MRKLIVLSFISLDGVMQAPGGPEEDRTGGFKYGGWMFGYSDDFLLKVMVKQMGKPFDLLLGRKTYEIFAAYWPKVNTSENPFATRINNAKKYVVSRTLTKLDWNNSQLIEGDVWNEIKKIKEQDGPEIQVHGSGNLIQMLLKYDLVDELWLKVFPITLALAKDCLQKARFHLDSNFLKASFHQVESSSPRMSVQGKLRQGRLD